MRAGRVSSGTKRRSSSSRKSAPRKKAHKHRVKGRTLTHKQIAAGFGGKAAQKRLKGK